MNVRLCVYCCWCHCLIQMCISTTYPQSRNCKPRDCIDLNCFRVSLGRDGPHTIYPGYTTYKKFKVACDQDTTRGGWAVAMRRVDGTLSFNKPWVRYQYGFGTPGDGNTNVWLGLQYWSELTIADRSVFRIEVFTHHGRSCKVETRQSYITSSGGHFKMTFRSASSGKRQVNIAGSLRFHNNVKFSTRDNSVNKACSERYPSGWWYTGATCHQFFLTGEYINKTGVNPKGMYVADCYDGQLLRKAFILTKPMDPGRVCYNPCQVGGTCHYVERGDTYRCACPKTRCGAHCEVASPCKNEGVCLYSKKTRLNRCRCRASYCGPVCEYHCENGGTCNYLADNNTYECICPEPLCGKRCEKISHCQNKGSCTYSVDAKEDLCQCKDTTCGPKCEFACKNGGTCVYVSDDSTHNCVCPDTHCGPSCEVENPCGQNVTCEYPPTTTQGLCDCPATHCGATCENENNCANNGTCEYNALTKTDSCTCPEGFAGANCSQSLADEGQGEGGGGEGDESAEDVVIQESSSDVLLPVCLFFLVVILGTVMFACMMWEKKKQDDRVRQMNEERERLLSGAPEDEDATGGLTHVSAWFGF